MGVCVDGEGDVTQCQLYFGHGKCEIIRLIHKSKEIQSCFATLVDATVSPAKVASAGSQIFANMYGGKLVDTLNSLRCIKYMIQHRQRSHSLKDRLVPKF